MDAVLLQFLPRINPNKVNIDVNTPLFFAACNGQTEIVKLLLNHPNVDPNKAANNGITPLRTGVLFGNLNIVKLLLNRINMGV